MTGRVGFGGTALVAGTASEAGELVSSAWQAGIRFFDTAPFYGHGLSESRLGAALGEHLEKAVLCTKVGIRIVAQDNHGTSDLRNRWAANGPGYAAPAYDPEGIAATFQESLARIGRHEVDFALLHGLTVFPHEAETHLGAARRALDDLRFSGKARGIGAAVNSIDLAWRMIENWSPDALLVAGALGLTSTEGAGRLVDLCDARGISLIAAAPYGGGAVFREDLPELDRICLAHDVSRLAAALQYPLRAAPVRWVVPAMSSPTRVDETLGATRTTIPSSFWDAIDRAGIGPMLR